MGIELMQARRGREKLLDLARGPARLCEALAVTKAFDGWDITAGRELWIADDPDPNELPRQITRSARIGVTSAHRRLLRFYLAGNPYVSGRRKLQA